MKWKCLWYFSWERVFSAPVDFFAASFCFRLPQNAQRTAPMKTRFPKRCLVVMEHMVFSVKPHYFALVMSCRLPYPKESCPWQAHYKSCLLQKGQARPPVPPTAGPHKRPSCQCPSLIWKHSYHRDEQGQCFSDKEPNGIFYSRFGVLSWHLLYSAGGISITARGVGSSALKNKWHHLAAQFHCHIESLIHVCFLFSAK